MGEIRIVEPVVRICAVISKYPDARQWAIEQLRQRWGQIFLNSEPLPFVANGFYTETMGEPLMKQLVAFYDVVEPGTLAEWKHETNAIEDAWAAQTRTPESRPLNLDSGYITQAKLVLATTKDRDHRIYLRDGMFAEVTLNYVGKKWIHHRWSYPDYRTPRVAEFATDCRNHLRRHILETGQWRRV